MASPTRSPAVVRDGSTPLWEQVLTDLRRRLAAGEFRDRFPGDVELVGHYEVSRHTVREAVRRLQDEGVLARTRGRGSVVVEPIEQPVGTLYSLFRAIEQRGMDQRSVVRHLDERHDDKASTMLGCPGDPLIYLERVRYAGDDPIAVDGSWLPAVLARPLLAIDFGHTALYDELFTHCDVVPTGGWERIRPVVPDRRQRQLLDLDAGVAAFAVERIVLAAAGPVEWRNSVVRGDRFSFVSRWASDQLDTSFEPTPLS